jgi:glycosidase
MDSSTVLSFFKQAVIYEVNTRQYSQEGNFEFIRSQLPRLKEMGVNILWMMPIHPIGIINRKGSLGSYYSSRDYYDINPEFGTKADFKALVDEAHDLGMKLIIDWVANHTAWDNRWTITHPEYFVRNESGGFVSPYDWADVIQLNHNEPSAHAAMQDAMLYWVKHFDIDGFRADLAHLTPLSFWVNARKEAEKIKPGLIWLAETENIVYYKAFDLIYAWKWMHQTESTIKNRHTVEGLETLLEASVNENPIGALQLFFTSNHDENSWNGTEYEKYGQFAKALAVFSFTWPAAVPLIYSGQEIPNLRRLAFFEKDPLHWPDSPVLNSFYAKLSKLRISFTSNDTARWLDAGPQVLAFMRTGEQQQMMIFLHLGDMPVYINLSQYSDEGRWQDYFTGDAIDIQNTEPVELLPGGYLLLIKT